MPNKRNVSIREYNIYAYFTSYQKYGHFSGKFEKNID